MHQGMSSFAQSSRLNLRVAAVLVWSGVLLCLSNAFQGLIPAVKRKSAKAIFSPRNGGFLSHEFLKVSVLSQSESDGDKDGGQLSSLDRVNEERQTNRSTVETNRDKKSEAEDALLKEMNTHLFNSDYGKVLGLFQSAKDTSPQLLSPKAYRYALSAMLEAKRYGECLNTIEYMAISNTSIGVGDFHIGLKACSRTRKNWAWQKASNLHSIMQQRGIQPDERFYGALLKIYASHGRGAKAVAVIDNMIQAGVPPDTGHFNAALRACREEPPLSRAVFTLMKGQQAGAAPTGQGEAAAAAAAAGPSSPPGGCRPDDYTLAYRLQAARAAGGAAGAREAEALLGEFMVMGVPPNQEHYALALGCCRDADSAQRLLELSGKVSPKCYQFAINVCQKAGEGARAATLAEEALGRGLRLPPGALGAALLALAGLARAEASGGNPAAAEAAAARAMALRGRWEAAGGAAWGGLAGYHWAALLRAALAADAAADAAGAAGAGAGVGAATAGGRGEEERGPFPRADALLAEMRARGLPRDEACRALVLGAAARGGHHARALQEIEEMEADGVSFTFHTYRQAIIAYSKMPEKSAEAVKLLKEMMMKGHKPDHLCWNAAVAGTARAGDWQTAAELAEDLVDGAGGAPPGPPPSPAALHTALGALAAAAAAGDRAAARRAPGLFRRLRGLQRPGAFAHAALARCQAALDDWPGALATLKAAAAAGHPPDGPAHCAALAACARAGARAEAAALLEAARRAGLTVDTYTSNNLMMMYAKEGDWEKTCLLLDQTKSPNTYSFNIALNACEKAYNGMQAQVLYGQMKQLEIAPDIITINTLMSALGKCNFIAEVLAVFEEGLDLGLEPDRITFGNLIFAHSRTSNCEAALLAIQMMKEKGVARDRFAYNAALIACEKCKEYQTAIDLSKEMREDSIVPDKATYDILLRICRMARRWDWLREALGAAEREGVRVGDTALRNVLTACAEAGEFNLGLEVLARMDAAGCAPGERPLVLLLALAQLGGGGGGGPAARAAAAAAAKDLRARITRIQEEEEAGRRGTQRPFSLEDQRGKNGGEWDTEFGEGDLDLDDIWLDDEDDNYVLL